VETHALEEAVDTKLSEGSGPTGLTMSGLYLLLLVSSMLEYCAVSLCTINTSSAYTSREFLMQVI
jgi:hypothetical protein